MDFEWDADKAAANKRKHGVPFEEATTVFDDLRLLVKYDAAHSAAEDRWNAIGTSNKLRALSVTYARRGGSVRIISARKATRAESQEYDEA